MGDREQNAERPPLAGWFTMVALLAACVYAFALATQLFLWDLLPGVDPANDPFAAIPPMVYVFEAVVFVGTAVGAWARLAGSRLAVPLSVVAAIVMLPSCPWTIASVVYFVREFRRERAAVRGGGEVR